MAFWRKDDKSDASQDPQSLVARREYDKAIRAYRALLQAQPANYILNHKIADALCLAGREKESVPDYSAAADGYAREGFLIKAVAILKKVQRIDPGNAGLARRLADLSVSGTSTPSIAVAPPAGPPPPDPAAPGPELAFDMEEAGSEPSIPVVSMDDIPTMPLAPPVTPLFSDFTPEERLQVFGRLRRRDFPAGAILVREGEAGASMFILCEGRVKVSTLDPKGEAMDLAVLKEGEFFGEVSLLTGKPRTATITCLEETAVLELTREDLREMEARQPRIREVIRDFYERRVASTVEAMVNAARVRRPPAGG